MALKELNLNIKKPKSITKNQQEDDDDTLAIELEGQEEHEDAEDYENIESNEESHEEVDDDNDDVQEDEDEDVDDNDTSEEEDGDDDEESDLDDDQNEDEDEDKPRGRRENHRIRSLVEERNIERAEREKAQKKAKDLAKQYVNLQKTTVESGKSLLKNHIESLKNQMVSAADAEDTKLSVDLQEKLNKAQQDLAALDNWQEPVIEEDEEDTSKNTKQNKEPPLATQKWLRKNVWFQNPSSDRDAARQAAAISYSNKLISEGYTMEDSELFELVDKRLVKLGLAPKNKNGVKSKASKGENTRSSDNGRKKPKKISQRIQGGSRNPDSNKSQSQRRKVTLTVEQQQIAELYGMTHEEYAREVLKIEDAKKAGRSMVPLFGDKK